MRSARRIAVAILSGALAVAPVPSLAATFTVNSIADAPDATPGDGICATAASQCTLRAAMQQADALGGTNTINVPAGTYVVSTGSLFSTKATNVLTINGTGGPLTTIVDGGLATGIFNLQKGTTNLNNLVIQNGSITVTNPGLFGICTGAGIFVSTPATVNVSASLISGNQTTQGTGGGICVFGTLNLIDSTVQNNLATNGGGGIRVVPGGAGATIINSTISGNQANGLGAAGGGIISQSTLVITNSTIGGNTATQGGGAGVSVLDGSTTSIRNSTITQNGGGGQLQVSGATATVASTIVANPSSGANCSIGGGGSVVSSGHNLESTNTCQFIAASDILNANPLLGPLQNNGGPTQTHALLPGSPAINAGTNSGCPSTDQRGIARPQGATCDIGAFEFGVIVAAVTLNGSGFHTGQQITYQATVNPGLTPTQVDIYLGCLLPDGVTLLSLVQTSPGVISFALGSSPTPFLANVPLAPLAVPFSFTFTGTEPAGTYVTYAGLAVAGSDPFQPANQLSLGVQAFQFTP